MLTITNQNQQAPTFKQRQVVSIGERLRNAGINTTHALYSSAVASAGLDAAVLVKPAWFTQPGALKYGLFAGVTTIIGLLIGRKMDKNAEEAKAARAKEEKIQEAQKNDKTRTNVFVDPDSGETLALNAEEFQTYLGLKAAEQKADAIIEHAHLTNMVVDPNIRAGQKYTKLVLGIMAQTGSLPKGVVPDELKNNNLLQIASGQQNPKEKQKC